MHDLYHWRTVLVDCGTSCNFGNIKVRKNCIEACLLFLFLTSISVRVSSLMIFFLVFSAIHVVDLCIFSSKTQNFKSHLKTIAYITLIGKVSYLAYVATYFLQLSRQQLFADSHIVLDFCWRSLLVPEDRLRYMGTLISAWQEHTCQLIMAEVIQSRCCFSSCPHDLG